MCFDPRSQGMAHVDRPPRSPSWWGRVPASPLGSSTGSLAWRLPSSSESLTDSEIRHDAAQSIAGFLLNQAPAAEKMQVEPSCPPKSIRKRTARSCPAHSIGPPTKRCSAPHAPLAGSTEDVPEPGRGPAELASDVRSARLNALFHLYGSNFRASVPAPRLHVASNHPTETAHMEPRQHSPQWHTAPHRLRIAHAAGQPTSQRPKRLVHQGTGKAKTCSKHTSSCPVDAVSPRHSMTGVDPTAGSKLSHTADDDDFAALFDVLDLDRWRCRHGDFHRAGLQMRSPDGSG